MSTSTAPDRPVGHPLATLTLFLVLVIVVGSVIGVLTAPGDWYAGLAKPAFNPPNWVFAPVWLLLYIAIAVAGWRIWRLAPKSAAMGLWGLQLGLNWLWSPTFFTLHALWPAFVVISAIWLAIIGFMFAARDIDRLASLLFAPYLAWVTFAAALNLAVALLN